MALFEQQTTRSGDAATRALSVTTVGTDFVEKVYQNIAQVYDYTYGPTLHPGRLEAIKKMRIRPGTRSARSRRRHRHQPRRSIRRPAASPASTSRARCSRRRSSASTRRVSPTATSMEMDATKLTFADNSLRRRLRAVRDQRRARSGRGRARDVSRVPSRRPRRDPQSLQERERADGARSKPRSRR